MAGRDGDESKKTENAFLPSGDIKLNAKCQARFPDARHYGVPMKERFPGSEAGRRF